MAPQRLPPRPGAPETPGGKDPQKDPREGEVREAGERARPREPWEVGPPWERNPATSPPPASQPLTTPPHGVPAIGQSGQQPSFVNPLRVEPSRPPPQDPSRPLPAPATGAGNFDLFGKRVTPKPMTVSELARQVRELLEGRFPNLLVQGEVSNLKAPGSGHVYFTLKDGEAAVDAVIFKKELLRLKFRPRDGLSVVVRGRLTFWNGRTQLVCDQIEPMGAGALQVAFEQLKARLSSEGLFDPARKRKLPFLPRRIAVITSPTGAAVHDFIRVLHRRFANLPVLIVPSKVQGEGAAQEIARAIARGASQPGVDVLVIARGGGSLEDLWAFNEEVVARALAACPVPTVSAVGHEVDFTIADFVADARAATPTAAAEMLARVKDELVSELLQKRARLQRSMRIQLEKREVSLEARRSRLVHPRGLIAERRLRLDRTEQRLADALREHLLLFKEHLRDLRIRLTEGHPRERVRLLQRRIAEEREVLVEATRAGLSHRKVLLERLKDQLRGLDPRDSLRDRQRQLSAQQEALATRTRARLSAERERLGTLIGRLDAMSPLKVLGRGYAVAFDANGRALRSVSEVAVGASVRVRLAQGELVANVTSVKPADT
ncbi:MAG: exodeoxyribonuclease VII large subunit [Deltaproteobacteria bacterium]|nr:exodeoxyribonuclease VII large subunit [Deltaproteobacteria bacterium]